MHLDFKLDESYTPNKIVVRAGTGAHDLKVSAALPPRSSWRTSAPGLMMCATTMASHAAILTCYSTALQRQFKSVCMYIFWREAPLQAPPNVCVYVNALASPPSGSSPPQGSPPPWPPLHDCPPQ